MGEMRMIEVKGEERGKEVKKERERGCKLG